MDAELFLENLMARLEGAYADNTIRAFKSDFRTYVKWCEARDIAPLPIDSTTLAALVDDMSDGYKSGTIRRRIDNLGTLAYLSQEESPNRSPEVKLALKRMHRAIGRAQDQAYPLKREYLNQMLKKCPKSTVPGLRNQILLVMGYETMRRRAELVAFRFEDLRQLNSGSYALFMRRSKTDQLGDGRLVPISEDLAGLIKRWAKMIKTSEGPILRRVYKNGEVGPSLSGASVNEILVDLQYRSRLRHLPLFSGHSFRVGAALDLLEEGAGLEEIMLRGGWASETTALRYLRTWAATADPLQARKSHSIPGVSVFETKSR